MNLADFIRYIRHLFGFILPGALWLLAVYLFSADKEAVNRLVPQVLHALQQTTFAAALVFGAISYTVGHAVAPLCFKGAKAISKYIISKVTSSKQGPADEEFEELACSLSATSPGPDICRPQLKKFYGWFHVCKFIASDRSEAMKEKLTEHENKINLLAMQPFPLLAVGVGFCYAYGFAGSQWLMLVLVSAVAVSLLIQVHLAILEERDGLKEMMWALRLDPKQRDAGVPGQNQVP